MPGAAAALLIGSLPRRRPYVCVCAVRILIFITATAKVLEKLRRRTATATTATAAHKVSASSANSQKLQIIFEPSACACVWSCLVTQSRNWRSSSRRCRQNELASRSQSDSLHGCACVCGTLLSACADAPAPLSQALFWSLSLSASAT